MSVPNSPWLVFLELMKCLEANACRGFGFCSVYRHTGYVRLLVWLCQWAKVKYSGSPAFGLSHWLLWTLPTRRISTFLHPKSFSSITSINSLEPVKMAFSLILVNPFLHRNHKDKRSSSVYRRFFTSTNCHYSPYLIITKHELLKFTARIL